jgi:hypothetical protein
VTVQPWGAAQMAHEKRHGQALLDFRGHAARLSNSRRAWRICRVGM